MSSYSHLKHQSSFASLLFAALVIGLSSCGQQDGEPSEAEKSAAEALAAKNQSPVSVFGHGVISTFAQEQSITFTASGDSCVYALNGVFNLAVKNAAGEWEKQGALTGTRPAIDHSATFGPDGNFYFSANTRVANTLTGVGFDLFVVRPTAEGWSAPEPLAELNSEASEYSPTFDVDGSLYFCSDRGEAGDFNIYRAQYVSGRFLRPLKLGATINTSDDESSVALAPTGQGILFARAPKPATLTNGIHDLYFSYKKDDVWQEAQLVHPDANGDFDSFLPSFSPDGLTAYFTSGRPLAEQETGGRRSFSSIFSISTVDLLNRTTAPN